MAKRGEQLREHILFTAKDVFLELGFERASMDAVAARAQTSKRSLYAHFESKDKLFLEVFEFVRDLVLARIGSPGDYEGDPAEALVRFLGRYLEILLYRGSVQMCRIAIAEATRLPQGAALFHDLMFTEIGTRVSQYMVAAFAVPEESSAKLAERLLGRILYPRYPRALFGLDQVAQHLNDDALAPEFDLGPIRSAVAELLPPPPRRQL